MSKNNKSAYNLRKCCFPDCCSKRESIPLVCIPKKGFEEWARLVSEHYGPAKNKHLSPFSLLTSHNPWLVNNPLCSSLSKWRFYVGTHFKKGFFNEKELKAMFLQKSKCQSSYCGWNLWPSRTSKLWNRLQVNINSSRKSVQI